MRIKSTCKLSLLVSSVQVGETTGLNRNMKRDHQKSGFYLLRCLLPSSHFIIWTIKWPPIARFYTNPYVLYFWNFHSFNRILQFLHVASLCTGWKVLADSWTWSHTDPNKLFWKPFMFRSALFMTPFLVLIDPRIEIFKKYSKRKNRDRL